MKQAPSDDLPTFIYENNKLIYQNKSAEELKFNTVLLDNLLEGSIILGETYLKTELLAVNLNGINLYYKKADNKNIFFVGNDIEKIKKVFDKILKSF